jgi:hypothetical protein
MGGRCEGDGFCRAGACVECNGNGTCDDDNECTSDTCSEAGACVFTPNGGTCNGGADVCSGGNCVDCLEGGGGCDGGEVCQGTTCVAACGGVSCDFGCNAVTNECNTCTPNQCGQNDDSASCIISVCRGGTSCEQGNRDGESCGDDGTGTCAGATCNPAEPPGGGDPPGGAGDPPGGGNGNPACDGVCDLLDVILCPQDCP